VNSFGEYIRNQRELRQISVEEVSNVTKVSYKYLRALENDRQELLPARPFIIGFLRVYSRYLGLDDDSVITRYISFDDQRKESEEGFGDETGLRRRKRFLSSILGLIVLFSVLIYSLL
jgi:cytoskeletal protein RodZ